MSALDRIDPELVEIVARLRRDPSSFLYQASAGGAVLDQLQAEVRPASRERATRAAERQLLAKHRDELAVWLLRGAAVALRQDPVFSKVYIVEDDSPNRRAWEPGEFRRGALIAMEDVARVAAHDLEREVGALRVLVGGSTELRGVLDACVLAERLRPFPSGAYLLGQAMLLRGDLGSAFEVVNRRESMTLESEAKVALGALLGVIQLFSGRSEDSAVRFRQLADSSGRASLHFNAAYAALVNGKSIPEHHIQAVLNGSAEQMGTLPSVASSYAAASTLLGVECVHATAMRDLRRAVPIEMSEIIGGGGDGE